MRKVIRVIGVLLLIAGIGFFSYPIVLRESFHRQARKAMEQFADIRAEGSAAQEGEDMLYADLRSAMFAYNEALYLSGQRGLIDQLSYEEPDFHLSDYGINSQVLGTISIPAIDVELPIYNGASEENMTKGAAYLANTSLPVGGENTNCVIAAHTRYHGVPMFKRITELQLGDEIYITNFWETLVYRVSETKVIDPSDSQNIYIQPGRSLVTLSTCHPFPKNYQRYLVYAELAE